MNFINHWSCRWIEWSHRFNHIIRPIDPGYWNSSMAKLAVSEYQCRIIEHLRLRSRMRRQATILCIGVKWRARFGQNIQFRDYFSRCHCIKQYCANKLVRKVLDRVIHSSTALLFDFVVFVQPPPPSVPVIKTQKEYYKLKRSALPLMTIVRLSGVWFVFIPVSSIFGSHYNRAVHLKFNVDLFRHNNVVCLVRVVPLVDVVANSFSSDHFIHLFFHFLHKGRCVRPN